MNLDLAIAWTLIATFLVLGGGAAWNGYWIQAGICAIAVFVTWIALWPLGQEVGESEES